jgi:ankyrin repeat protein
MARSVVVFAVANAILVAGLEAGELHDAVRVCDPDRVKALLASGAGVRVFDSEGNTPLDVAIMSRRVECVKLLLDKQAGRLLDAKARPLAAKIEDIPVRAQIELLLLRSEQGQSSGSMPWSLLYVASHGQLEVGRMLLNMGANPNEVGPDGTTPLHQAALHSDPAMVALLLSKGASVDVRSKDGALPIHDAALGKSAEVVRFLAAKGASIASVTQDEMAQTPLHMAASFGRLEVIKALLDLGASIDVKDAKGRTPLDVAIANSQTEAATLIRASNR